MRDRNDRRSGKKTRGECGQSRKHVVSMRLPRDFVEMLERAGRQYVLPAKSRCLPVKWLGCFSNRKWSEIRRTGTRTLRRSSAGWKPPAAREGTHTAHG